MIVANTPSRIIPVVPHVSVKEDIESFSAATKHAHVKTATNKLKVARPTVAIVQKLFTKSVLPKPSDRKVARV